ncbi:MAG: Cd(II)/Pb(II)-responsive transcriptional regulator [Candidatus Accumulibacter sp.]|uniref:Cd(II)/Pb(II)-responsive transcriptional regulator n=1 Tax=Accumulibacter sp. TaxID=2053492 RepID=UPI001A3836C5|nr:Cd(II)/Pb(II)-responsive transcriptional regulator [Accumulibacter sp.]MBL8394540.1 Cd(II)/Pb(II)-responsive transcriptional regulator [Accumulibacter sp.]
MKIGGLAQVAQCTVQTIRYYEQEGLLPVPERSAANYRSYGQAHVDRLRFIRNCRALDMTHEEIRVLLGMMDQPAGDCRAINRLLDEHIGHVDMRINELLQLQSQLVMLRELCQSERSIDACGILQGLAAMETEIRHPRPTHLG